MGPNCIEALPRAGDRDVASSHLHVSPIKTSPTAFARKKWPFRTQSRPGNARMGPNLCIGAHGETEGAGRSVHAGGTSSWILAAHDGKANGKGGAGGAGPNRRKSPLRTGRRASYPSCLHKLSMPTSPTISPREQSLFRKKPLTEHAAAEPHLDSRPR